MRFIFSSSSVWRTSRLSASASRPHDGNPARPSDVRQVSDAQRRLLQAGPWLDLIGKGGDVRGGVNAPAPSASTRNVIPSSCRGSPSSTPSRMATVDSVSATTRTSRSLRRERLPHQAPSALFLGPSTAPWTGGALRFVSLP